MEKIYKVPKGFVPTKYEQEGRKLKVQFTKFKHGIRWPMFEQKKRTKEYILPKKTEVAHALTIERGLTPSKFRVKLEKIA